MKPPHKRLESVAAWGLVGLAWLALLLGLVGPLLGGPGPGLKGPVGFASETVAAMWVPGGLLTALLALAALARRHRWPAVALAPIALFTLLPELWAGSRPLDDRLRGDGPPLRVATVSLEKENKEDPLMEACLREIDADVLVLLEVTKPWALRLEQWFGDDYPHRWLAAVPEPGSREELRIAVLSRLPAAGECEVVNLGKLNSQIRVPLRWRDHVFALYGIHPRKPYPYAVYARAWRDRTQVLDWIGRESMPTVVAGDFNATPRSAFFRRLRELGLANASEAVCGCAPVTWPMHPVLLAPLRVAIDHVMYSDEFAAVAFRKGLPTNSVHSSICAELVWRKQ